MKLVSLNVWGGRLYRPLMVFIRHQAIDTDIFCFQEIYHTASARHLRYRGHRTHIFSEMNKVLKNFLPLYAPFVHGHELVPPVAYEISCGNAVYVKKNCFSHTTSSEFLIYERRGNERVDSRQHPRIYAQECRLRKGNVHYTIINVHGAAFPGDKLDTPERIAQSKNIIARLKKSKGNKIVCGDFNLYPKTKSITILEKPLKNLIKDYTITDTRGPINHAIYSGREQQYFSDYTFVSRGVRVHAFEVPETSISDHLPMILTFH